jgi:DNA-binding NarL/FixJ family response regulator
MTPLRILVADDHTLVRQGLRKILESQPGWVVVGEAGDGRDAVQQTMDLQPDVVIMDIAMPRLNGVEAVQQIERRNPNARVLVLSMYSDEAYVTRAVRAGAAGYLLKSAPPQEVVRAIRAAHDGDAVIDPKTAGRLLEALARTPAATQPLTPRERDVLTCVCRGMSNKAIARELGLAEKTVKTHVGHILAKLGVTDRTQAALLAVREGLAEC